MMQDNGAPVFRSINELSTLSAIWLALFGRINEYEHPIEEGKLQRVTAYYQWRGEKYRIGEYLRKPEEMSTINQ